MLVVAIEREEKRNAIDQAIADGIGAALDRLDDDPELWVGVITGTVDGVLRRAATSRARAERERRHRSRR